MEKRILLGMLTPSSNTILEPVTSAMVSGLDEVSAHFGRFEVTRIGFSSDALKQFDLEPILQAARLLAHAKVDVIAWNGTSSGWLGFETDQRLCQAITAETGIPATTSVLALNEILAGTGVERFGLVTPYLDAIQEAIIANYRGAGFECVSERHLDDEDNFGFSEVSQETIRAMLMEVAKDRPDAVTTFCTNLKGATLAEEFERETGIPLYDTISTAVWKSLAIAGVDTARVKGWGRLFYTRGH